MFAISRHDCMHAELSANLYPSATPSLVPMTEPTATPVPTTMPTVTRAAQPTFIPIVEEGVGTVGTNLELPNLGGLFPVDRRLDEADPASAKTIPKTIFKGGLSM